MDYKQRIIEEASQMFRTYGIRSVTMDMLASHMGISKRTIYEVFRDKDDLLHGVLKWMTVRQQEVMKKLFSESENVIEAIFKMLKLMSDHISRMSPAFQLDVKKFHKDILMQLSDRNELPYYAGNSEILKKGIAEGVFREDIDVNITNKCLLEVVRMSYDESIFPPDAFLNKDVVKNFYINYLRGISTQKGLDLIDYYQNREII